MSKNVNEVVQGLTRDATEDAERAFRKSLGNVESIAKDLAPVGHYKRSRGKAGKAGGDLRVSLRVEFIGRNGNTLVARCTSPIACATVQHDEAFHHPGLYTGAAGERFKSKFFERAVEMIFGEGKDPLAKHSGSTPATFKEILAGN